MASRRSNQPKELVRFSPLQFSLSVSIVVILLGAAALAGYFYGLKRGSLHAAGPGSDSSPIIAESGPEPDRGDTRASVTFYSTLTKPRKDLPSDPPLVKKPSRTPISEKRPSSPGGEEGVEGPSSGIMTVMLQVASYKSRESAQALLQELSSEGHAGTVVKADLGERGVWFRVRVGPYRSESDARRVLEKLKKERSLKGYVVK